MGDPNVLWFHWDLMASSVNSPGPANTRTNQGPPLFGLPIVSLDGDGALVMTQKTFLHELHVIETGTGFPNSGFDPKGLLEFQINSNTYYNINWTSRVTPPFKVDFSIERSNTLFPPPDGLGDPPLILEKDETIKFIMSDHDRPNNFDTYRFEIDLWGLRVPD